MQEQAIRRMVKRCFKRIPREKTRKPNSVCIFGTGQVGLIAHRTLKKKCLIDCFLDNDRSKWGQKINNVEIKEPNLDNMRGKIILIASSFRKEIATQLCKLGLKEGQHFFYLFGDRNLIYSPLYIQWLNLLSKCFPRDKKQVVIGSWFGERFADNSRYMYLILDGRRQELDLKRVTWITQNKSVYDFLKSNHKEVAMKGTWRSIWRSLRAKYHIIDQQRHDIDPRFSAGAVRVQLWHGVPLKKLYGDQYLRSADPDVGEWNSFCLLASSDRTADLLNQEIGVGLGNIFVTTPPRNQVAFDNKLLELLLPEEREWLERIVQANREGKKIIGYFPTFRETYTPQFDLVQNSDFHQWLETQQCVLVVKEHFNTKKAQSLPINQHIFMLPKEIDLYPFLGQLDILVTDYSSIYFDFLFYRKPILFYPYDYEIYRDHERGFSMDFEAFTPGEKVYHLDDVMHHLTQILEKGDDGHREARERVLTTFFNIEGTPDLTGPISFLFRKNR